MQDEYTAIRVGKRLRSMIEGQGETLASFSRRCGVPYRSIQDYVAGKSRPGFEQLVKFASAGLDIGFILTGTHVPIAREILPDAIKLSDTYSLGIDVVSSHDIDAVMKSINEGIDLRTWIQIWNLADDCVPAAADFGLEHRRRQGAVAFVASGIVVDLVQRLKVLGWLEG